jgi:hypothetical protein
MTSAHNAPGPTHFSFLPIAFPGERADGETDGLYVVGGVTNERPRGAQLLFSQISTWLSSLTHVQTVVLTANTALNKATEH